MSHEEPDIIDPDEEWGHRRHNMRHDVAVPATITDRLGIVVACEIADVSRTGMALAIEMITDHPGKEPLKQGTLARLEFAPDPVNAPDDRVAASVRVMWRAPTAVGVRFEEVTPAIRAALRTVAANAVSARIAANDLTRRELEPAQRAILQACRRTLQKQLPNLLWAMRTDVVARLRASGEGHGTDARGAREDADCIEDKAMAITRTIEHQFLQGFGEASDLEQTQELTMAQIKAGMEGRSSAIGVLEDDAVEHSARITAIAHAVAERFKSTFFEIDVRLANVLGRQLDEKTNPLVPASACRILWYAVISYCDSPRVQKQLQQTMIIQVMPLLGELYDALNATLDEHGARRIFDVRQEHAFGRD